jgi:hypothetical protein
VYAALLIYNWRFISWFWAFWGVTLVVLLFAIGNLWWEIYWGRRLHQGCKGCAVKIHKKDNQQDSEG